MNRLRELRQRFLWLSDLSVAIELGVILHFILERLHLKIGLSTDLISLLMTALSAISFGAYVSFVPDLKSERIKRLAISPRYKNILFLFLGYMTVAIAVFVLQLLIPDLNITEYILALCVVAFYRFMWVFVRTIKLL